MWRLLDHRMAWALVVVAGGWVACSVVTAAEQPGSTSDSKYVPGGKADSGEKADSAAPGASTNPKHKKLVDKFARKLGSLKPPGNPKEDYFLVGTAVLTLATGHADVRFQVKRGQQAAAELLVDFVLGAPENTVHKWHVFSRLKDAQQADTALAQIRAQYDQMVAYQEQLKKIYGATTIRRC